MWNNQRENGSPKLWRYKLYLTWFLDALIHLRYEIWFSSCILKFGVHFNNCSLLKKYNCQFTDFTPWSNVDYKLYCMYCTCTCMCIIACHWSVESVYIACDHNLVEHECVIQMHLWRFHIAFIHTTQISYICTWCRYSWIWPTCRCVCTGMYVQGLY